MRRTRLAHLTALASLLLMLSCAEPFFSEIEDPTNEPLAMALIVEPEGVVLGIGRSVQLRATPRAASGEVVGGYSIAWESSDDGVVSVGEDGQITGVSLGSARVSATAEKSSKGRGRDTAPGQLKKSKNVVIDPVVVATVEVDPGPATIEVGGTVQLAAIVRDSQGNVLENRLVTWSSSEPAIATVDGRGRVEGLLAGSATIAAESEGISGTAVITVTPALIVDAVLWPENVTLDVGQRAQFYAAFLRSDGFTSCIPESPSLDAEVLFNGAVVAGCDSATARLDFSLVR